jgi:hypothetical protein
MTFTVMGLAELLAVGSLVVEVHEDIWPRPQVGSVGPHWMQTQYVLDIYGVCGEVESLRLEHAAVDFRAFMDGEERPLRQTFTEVLHRLIGEQRAYKEQLLGKGQRSTAAQPPKKPTKKPTKKPAARRNR